MPNEQKRCPKCGSSEWIPDLTLESKGAVGIGDVVAQVECHPHALLFKGLIRSPLKATVCGNCGFTELYANDPHDLLAAYRMGQSEH